MINKIRIALIPAYEPEDLLLNLLYKVRDAGLIAIVIDDGSDSSFSNIFEQAAELAVVLIHPENYEKGHAIKTGLRAFSSELLPPLLDIAGERYEYEMNVLLEFAQGTAPFLLHRLKPSNFSCGPVSIILLVISLLGPQWAWHLSVRYSCRSLP